MSNPEPDNSEIPFLIDQFIRHFKARLVKVDEFRETLLTHHTGDRKIIVEDSTKLYITILDTLAKCRFPNSGNKSRFIDMMRTATSFTCWYLISTPQLYLLLKGTPLQDTKIYAESFRMLQGWRDSGTIKAEERDQSQDEWNKLSTSDEEYKAIEKARYDNLFYSLRNHLIHEDRPPGYSLVDIKKNFPIYDTYIVTCDLDIGFELNFPIQFIKKVVNECLDNLKGWLEESNIDPNDSYRFGSLWIKK